MFLPLEGNGSGTRRPGDFKQARDFQRL